MAFQIPDHITWKNLESGTILLNLNSSNYYTLNETATKIWIGITEGMSEREILAQLENEFDCSEEERQTDLKEHISRLISKVFIIETE